MNNNSQKNLAVPAVDTSEVTDRARRAEHHGRRGLCLRAVFDRRADAFLPSASLTSALTVGTLILRAVVDSIMCECVERHRNVSVPH
jgi:hypothetical protein